MHLSERNWTQLNETEIAQLQTIAEATRGRSSGMAKGVLCFFYNICYEDEIEEGGTFPPIGEPNEVKNAAIEQEQNLNYELFLYPNPTKSEMTVTLSNPSIKIIDMELFDVYGKKVHQQTVNQSYGTLKLKGLNNGIYILKVHLNQGDMVIRKVVKK